jgi:hypothetical protein
VSPSPRRKEEVVPPSRGGNKRKSGGCGVCVVVYGWVEGGAESCARMTAGSERTMSIRPSRNVTGLVRSADHGTCATKRTHTARHDTTRHTVRERERERKRDASAIAEAMPAQAPHSGPGLVKRTEGRGAEAARTETARREQRTCRTSRLGGTCRSSWMTSSLNSVRRG